MPADDGSKAPGATGRDDPGTRAPRRRRSRLRRVLLAIAAVLALVAAGGSIFFAIPQPLLPEASAAMAPTPLISVRETSGWITFSPVGRDPSTGLVIYPGGKVAAQAYAPAAAAIAGKGFLAVIVPMPLNLAVLGIDRAAAVMAAHPGVRHWAVGGHSLGGAMAAQFLAGHPGAAEGLALWAAYSAVDLSDQPLRTLVVFGTLDAGVDRYVSAESLGRLPADPAPRIVEIPGGNHEQMGWYSGQPNDPPATVQRAAQQELVVQATVALLAALDQAEAP